MTESEYSTIRPCAFEEHPLNHQDYLLPTDSISFAWGELDKVLRRRSGGFIMWGYSRIGKSSAITYLMCQAQAKYKGLYAALMDGTMKTYISERDFFSTLCESLGCATGGAAVECRRRAIKTLVSRGGRNVKRLFLLFIDEPQKWTDIHMQWICEVYDKLEENNIRLITVLVGQPALTSFRETYIERKNIVIVDRLMKSAIQFRGIQSPDQLRYVLSGYDTLAHDVPEWPFTRFFFPEAFASGFRLEQYYEPIWDGFAAVIDLHGKFIEYWLPMKHITAMIELLFLEYHHLDAVDFVIDRGLVDELVREVEFLLYLEMIDSSVEGEASGRR
ncbi:hypothetical protein QLG10_01970 [Pseudomonas sp. V98_8]|uniref:hypothetical protein n=1 Tax=Pseudomonas sp. V98_8 TaxID=3044228 RepID=UPI00249F7AA8|nr:hypothetical protein [Pseudomonas sp. V98_8]MDI3391192.1 hypothetical protein [Pseudomonas sp. V98_8]